MISINLCGLDELDQMFLNLERTEMAAKRKPAKKGSTKTKVKEKVPGTGRQPVPGEGMKKKKGR